jgi:hypothetical protein
MFGTLPVPIEREVRHQRYSDNIIRTDSDDIIRTDDPRELEIGHPMPDTRYMTTNGTPVEADGTIARYGQYEFTYYPLSGAPIAMAFYVTAKVAKTPHALALREVGKYFDLKGDVSLGRGNAVKVNGRRLGIIDGLHYVGKK